VLEQLPREAVDPPRPSVEVLKARLDGALGSLGWSEMGRLVARRVVGGWSSIILEVTSNPFCVSLFSSADLIWFIYCFFQYKRSIKCGKLKPRSKERR